MIISHMPIANDILERRSKLSPAKRILLEKRVSGGFTGNSKSHIPRQPKQGFRPPSFGQQRVWFADQMEPNSAGYNRPAAVRLRGPLNVEALEQGLQEILARHEALRTTFSNVKGQLAQIISPPVPLHLTVVDLSRVSKPEQETQALRLVNEEARRPFDLVHGPLQRMNLLRLGEDEHILVLVIHHIVFDGWSLGVLFRELGLLYESFLERKPSPLPELPIQYADFAVWQRNYLQGEALEAQLAYWGKQLGGRLPVLQLPTDRPRAVIQTYHTGRHMLTLPKVLTGALKALSRSEEVTVYMTLLAAFQTLLNRYTGQEDILVGSPLAGRTRSETEGLIGFFVNTLVMRANLSGNPSFRHLLRRVRKLAVEAYAHQDLPFEKLVEVLQPERALGRMPLFNVMFQLRNIPERELKLSGLEVEDFEFDRKRESLDLSLEMVEKAEELSCLFEYNSDLFDAATISRMAGHFQTLLNSIVTDPGQTLSGLSLLTEAEGHQLLVEWNDTKTKYPQDKCIHELFEQQVEQTPDAVAIVFENQQLTYSELNAKANQLARYLRRLGVGPEVLVGICLDRSLEMIVGVLSILKAGGAYVPLDPAYPSERLSFMLEDAGVSLLLTQEGQLENLRCHSARVVCLDRDREVIAHERTGNVDSGVAAENSSHVIYTSGSTGRPKGVVLEHHNTCTLINWALQTYTSEELAGVLASASICFDLSVFEIFVPLSCGGTIILADNALHLPTLLAAEKVTLVLAVPSALTELIRIEGIPSSVQTINSCGEVLQSALVQRIFQQANIKKVCNLYGPTEDAVCSTYSKISPEESPTIGRPIANTRIYILDRHLQPVPVGVQGELHIGGGGLARGYLNRPELTAEKFVPNPFSAEQGARLYKTGDLACYRPDGNIDFLGRLDHQVKVRGYRVELGEVEAVLRQHPSVSEAVVLAQLDLAGNQRLVAHVIATRDAPSSSELRDFLKRKLPQHMVPSIFMPLQNLPLTPNGKVDRKVLASADVSRDEVEGTYQPARTPMEEMIVEIWAGILGIKQVGIHDNFFELGGHSLIATRIMSRMREAFEVELPVRALFESPTVAGQAERVEAAWQADRGLQAPALKSVLREQDLPLSFAQQRLWFLDQLEPNNPFYNVSQAISLRGLLDTRALAQTINTIVSRHESLRTTFQSVDGWPRQVIVDRVTMELPIRDLNHLRESERETEARRLATEEARRPFDLAAGPLIRASLVRLTEDDHVLLLTMHHIISDGWSLGILTRELGTLYEAYAAGQPSPLPELLIQYADYAVWQRQWLQGEVLEKQLAYWKERLGGDLPLLALPTDRPRPAVQTYGGSRQSIELPMRLVEQLRQMSQREEATLYMLCLAAFQMLLSRHCGQEDIIVGSPIAGRNRAETEGLIGFFVNTLVMRTDLSGNPSFRELLVRVKEMTLGAYEHQDLPFEKLVEELQPERSLSYSPIFQVFFALQSANFKAAAPGQLKFGSFGFDNRTTRFDLEVHLGETADGRLNCTFVHNTDLFDAATVRRMITHYQTLLESVVAHPEEQICRLELLTGEEREQLLVKWNNTQREYPREQTIHRLFEAQVERTPDAVAAVFNDEQLTYRQLNERANQIAHCLQGLGVGPEVLVAICVNRSLEMVIGLLGILKAGGAYVPLDPDYPQERLSFIIEDAGALVLLTQERLVKKLPGRPARVVCLDRDFERINSESVENVNSAVGSNNLAYVIYTSGSTGRPKGVAIEHDSTVALLDWSKAVFAAEDLAGVLASTSICFDLSVFELFVTLTRGGKVIVALDALHLIELAAAQEVRLINTVPSAIADLVRVGGIPSSVRTVNVAGEPLAQALVEKLYEHEGVERVLDLYGPSEATTYSTYALRRRQGVATIGRPISNTQVYILDKQMEPVPIGVAAELYIGGDGLARGYLNRSELTSEKFIANPFSDDLTARLYKTGDIGRYLADGNIEFLGRIDHQVKIRGYRIELGEIESVLNQHAGVSESVVVAKEYELGDKRLVAYVIGGGDERPSPSELRKHLKERLPDYMVPTAFVLLDEMPLTPNGKVNRKALLDSDETQPEIKETSVAPRNASEEVLGKIWGEILGLEQVGVFDNFFELGGHSLLATRVMSRVSDVFEIRVLLRAFFEQPTVAGLAELVSDAKKKHREPTPAIRRRPRA